MRTFAFTLFMAILSAAAAGACIAPTFDHHYPSCQIPLPMAEERVVVLTAAGWDAPASHHLGESTRPTHVNIVDVAENPHRNYLVLSARRQTIWLFEGDLSSVSRVIVLGAAAMGPEGAGVIGLPEDKIIFTKPDLSLLDPIPRTSCTWVARSCPTAQWFSEGSDPRVSFYPPREEVFIAPDAVVNWNSANSDRKRGRPVEPFSLRRPDGEGAVIAIDPAEVVSVEPPQPYAQLPGAAGLRALVAGGALHPAGTEVHSRTVANYAERFSARYRSRFDPDFLFTPHVDYVVTKPVVLPTDLPGSVFLVASGVEMPDMNGNSSYRACLFLEDRADAPIEAGGRESPLCREIHIGTRREDRDVLSAASGYDRASFGGDCLLEAHAEGTHHVAVALSEGTRRRFRDDPVRQIDITVEREGPVVLYLSIEGGPVLWNLSGPDVAGVYMRQGTQFGMHRVVLNGEAFEQSVFGRDVEGCRTHAPLSPNRLGPSIAHLDRLFEAFLGHGIDELIVHTETRDFRREGPGPTRHYVVE